jgi:hypothetical protein
VSLVTIAFQPCTPVSVHVYNLSLSNAIIHMALAQRLNELAVANSEGLLQYVSLSQPVNIPGSDDI